MLKPSDQQKLNELTKEYEKLQERIAKNGRAGHLQVQKMIELETKLQTLRKKEIKLIDQAIIESKSLESIASKLNKQHRKISASNKDQSIIGLQIHRINKDLIKDSQLLVKGMSQNVANGYIQKELGKELGGIIEDNAAGMYDTETIQSKINELQQLKIDGLVDEHNERKELNKTEKDSIDLTLKTLKQKKQALSLQDLQKKKENAIKKATEDTGSSLGLSVAGPLVFILSLLKLFSSATDEIGKKFGALGVVNFRNQLRGASVEFVRMGLSSEEALVVADKLSTEFGITFENAINAAKSVGEFAKATGLGVTEASSLVGLLMQTQGLSADIAINTLKQTQALAMANGVAPGKVLRDIASSTETFAKFSKEGGKNIFEAAVQARKLGLSLDAIGGSAESLLDFQSSLNAEITAGILLGRRINLQRARELSLMNDMTGLQDELLNQVGSEAEFNEMNVFQRKALAKAIGMTVPQLQKLVSKEKEAVTLAGELAKQDISSIVSENAISKTAELINNLKAIGMEIAETYGPSIERLVKGVFNFVMGIEKTIGIMPILIGLMTTMAAKSMLTMVTSLMTAYGVGAASLGPGAIAAIAAAPFILGGLVTSIMSATRVGDVDSPAKGKTQVSTKEGSLFELSPKDDFAAAPGLLDALKPKKTMMPMMPGVPFDAYHGFAHKPFTDFLSKSNNLSNSNQTNKNNLNQDNAGAMRREKELMNMREEIGNLRKDMASYFGFGGTMKSKSNMGNLSGGQIT